MHQPPCPVYPLRRRGAQPAGRERSAAAPARDSGPRSVGAPWTSTLPFMSDGTVSASAPAGPGDPPPHALVDLLGLLAYAELASFFRLSGDAALAPALSEKAEVAGLAATEYEHFTRLRDRLSDMGVDAAEAMGPFVEPLDAWHARTLPRNWLESLVKTYIGDGITGDFYRQLAELVDDEATRDLAGEVLSGTRRAEFIVARVRPVVAEDPVQGGRLALWARRLVGEALTQARGVAADRPELAALLAGDGPETRGAKDASVVGRVFARITDAHTARIEALGLTP